MGFVYEPGTVSQRDSTLVAIVMGHLSRAGSVRRTVVEGGVDAVARDPARVVGLLNGASATLDDSPLPGQEWIVLRDTLGDDLLARLCRISVITLRRYASSSRPTPDVVAQRLHALALIVADLRGVYNDYGIRRWFQRPRAQLEGLAPADFLPPDWTLDGPQAMALRDLAGALRGSPAT